MSIQPHEDRLSRYAGLTTEASRRADSALIRAAQLASEGHDTRAYEKMNEHTRYEVLRCRLSVRFKSRSPREAIKVCGACLMR